MTKTKTQHSLNWSVLINMHQSHSVQVHFHLYTFYNFQSYTFHDLIKWKQWLLSDIVFNLHSSSSYVKPSSIHVNVHLMQRPRDIPKFCGKKLNFHFIPKQPCRSHQNCPCKVILMSSHMFLYVSNSAPDKKG